MLFAPAVKLDKFAKYLQTHSPDLIIFDLEDSVKKSHKSAARETLARYTIEEGFNYPFVVRINEVTSDDFGPDIQSYKRIAEVNSNAKGILIPKVNSPAQLKMFREACHDLSIKETSLSLICVLVETLSGYRSLEDILKEKEHFSFIGIGYEDLSAEMLLDRPALYSPSPLNTIIQNIIITCKIHSIPVIDTVCRKFKTEDLQEFKRELEYGKSIGFFGKMAIHPNQVPLINSTYDINHTIKENLKLKKDFEDLTDGSFVIVDSNGEMQDTPSYKKANKLLDAIKVA